MSNHASPAFSAPPAEVVEFLQRVFDFAETLEPADGQALRRLVRAGLLADDGTITSILHDDAGGYSTAADLHLAANRPVWYLEGAAEHPLLELYR